jgi:hypothetical protein
VPHPYLLRKAESWDRWFDEPDFGLNSGPFPHEVGCNKTGTLALMGIFSTAAGKQRRDL